LILIFDMPRFSLMDLFFATTYLSAGLASLCLFFSMATGLLGLLLWFIAGALIGAGILAPFKRMQIGAAIGILVQLAVLVYQVFTIHPLR